MRSHDYTGGSIKKYYQVLLEYYYVSSCSYGSFLIKLEKNYHGMDDSHALTSSRLTGYRTRFGHAANGFDSFDQQQRL